MKYYSTSIPMEVLNPETGEFETKRFTQDSTYNTGIKQGWRRMYIAYDEVMEHLNSQKEIQMFIHIRNLFTKSKPNVNINQTKLAKEFDVNRVTLNRFVKKLTSVEFINKEDDSSYRMNPYMFIPYRADAKTLQEEWNERIEDEN